MKNKIFSLLVILLTAVTSTACVEYAATPNTQNSNETVRHISVTGDGQVYLTPDIVYINVGVRTQSEDPIEALNENNERANTIHEQLSDKGIDEKDIQTSSLNVYPQQQYGPEGEITSTMYIVENSVNITIRDVDQLGDILNSVVKSGANNINSINFDVDNKEEALNQAREMAVADAHQQALQLADAAGVELGDLLSINTNMSNVSSQAYSSKRVGVIMEEAASVPISAGQMIVSLQADLVYAIR